MTTIKKIFSKSKVKKPKKKPANKSSGLKTNASKSPKKHLLEEPPGFLPNKSIDNYLPTSV